jgi:hypothetical protein
MGLGLFWCLDIQSSLSLHLSVFHVFLIPLLAFMTRELISLHSAHMFSDILLIVFLYPLYLQFLIYFLFIKVKINKLENICLA